MKLNKLSFAVVIALSSGLSVAAAAKDQDSKSIETMNTVTVVGNKTNKDLKHTTTAVTVLDSDQFENGEKQTVNDRVTTAPNVISEGFGSVTIRGISGTGAATGQYAYLTGSRSRVATIVDGVTQRWTGYSYSPSGLWDVKSVEVLRGPQSTTQGTNAIGGALVSTTNDPTFQYEAAVRSGLENYENGNIKKNLAVMFNAPLIDNQLALRVAADGSKGEGWLNYAQETDQLDNGPDVNDSENLNLRTKLLWQPSALPGLTAKLTYNYHKYKGEFLTWVNDSDDNYRSQTLTLKASSQNGNTRLQDTDVHTVATDVTYDFDNGISNLLHMDYQFDHITFYQYPLNKTQLDNKLYTFEFDDRTQFALPGSAWSGMTGLYFSRERNNFVVNNEVNDFTTYVSTANSNVSALYGETTYALTSAWNLIGGARLEHNSIDRDMTYAPKGTAYDLDQDSDETILLPKIGMTYDVTDSTTIGGNIRRGYNAGGAGLNMSTDDYYAYGRETVIAYELTTKTQFGSRASLVSNLFYNDYNGYQALSDYEITNVDASHTYGLELEGTLWATDDLMLRGSAGLLNSKIDANDDGEGGQLPFAPHTNLSVGFTQYISDNLSFGADTQYVGRYYSDLANTSDLKAGDYFTADARLSYTWGNFTLNGYIKNLTNEDVILLKSSSPERASVGQTRTYGLNLTYKM